MRKILCGLMVGLMMWVSVDNLTAEEKKKKELNITWTNSFWETTGGTSLYGGAPPKGGNSTYLLEHPVDSTFFTSKIELLANTESSSYSFEFSFINGGNIRNGAIVDTDWNANGVLESLSVSNSDGDTGCDAFYLGYGLHKRSDNSDNPSRLEFQIGYLAIENHIEYRAWQSVIDDYDPYSEYDARVWQTTTQNYWGWEYRIKGVLNIGETTRIQAIWGVIPSLSVEEDMFRYAEIPEITTEYGHIQADGEATEYEISITQALGEHLGISLGYKSLEFSAKGIDVADSDWAGCWNEYELDFKGFFWGILLSY